MKFQPIQKEERQYRVGSLLLLCFSASFAVWQMGILYFSGTTMSLFGRTPIPLTDKDTTLVIAAGYLASIVALCLFPRKVVWMERMVMPTALVAAALMLLPLSPALLTALFYLEAFICVFTIGVMGAVAVCQLTVETLWRDGVIGAAVCGLLIGLLQNDWAPLSFTAFSILCVLLIAAQTLFYYVLPAGVEIPFASRREGHKIPGIFFFGLWLVNAISTLLICFASSYAESVPGGVSALYLSSGALAVLLYAVRKKLGTRGLRVFGGFLALSVFGFVLAFLSIQFEALRLVACGLLGCVVVLAGLWLYFAALSFRAYPTRFIGVICAGMGLVLAALHSLLLRLLRDNIAGLYGIYAALSVALFILYFFLEPYILYAWENEKRRGTLTCAPGRADTSGAALPGGGMTVGSLPLQVCAPADRGGLCASPGGAKTASPAAADTRRVAPSADGAQVPEKPPFTSSSQPIHPHDVLTEQERRLVALILEGYTETSIAQLMNITLNTQKSYRKNVYAKLGIHSKRELFEIAQKGLRS